jgi:hypothetical protein
MHSCHATQIGLRGRRGDVGRCVIRALSIERGRSRIGERLLLGYPASDRVVVIIVVPKFVSVVTADSVSGMLRFCGRSDPHLLVFTPRFLGNRPRIELALVLEMIGR